MNTACAVLTGALVALAGCKSATGGPTVSTLKSDGYVSGSVSFQGGFLTGDAGATVLGPASSASTLKSVLFLYGGAAATDSITLTVYADAGNDAPGSVLYSHDYLLTASDAAFQQIDLTAQHIAVDAGHSIRVAVFFKHDGLPSLPLDGDGIVVGKSYIYTTGGWIKNATAGVNDDWVIRAEIVTQ